MSRSSKAAVDFIGALRTECLKVRNLPLEILPHRMQRPPRPIAVRGLASRSVVMLSGKVQKHIPLALQKVP
jgi:hypothetical protein